MEALKHKEERILPNGDKLRIEIRIGDERLNRSNGHADFAITADLHEKKGSGWAREPYAFGCLHDEILQHAPELAPFVALHLSDQYGAPMYAAAKGYYFLTNDVEHDRSGKTRREHCQDHLRATDAEMDVIATAADPQHFAHLIAAVGLPARWEKEAQEAIAQLEKWTGYRFTFTPTRRNFTPLDKAQEREILALVESGHFAPEKVEERKREAQAANDQKWIEDRKAAAEKKIGEIRDGLRVDLFMHGIGYGDAFRWNWIHYTHNNTITFGPWDHVAPAREDVIERTREAVAAHADQLPEGIKVEIKRK